LRRSCSKKGLGGLLRQCEIRPNKINRLEKFPATHDSLGVVPFSEPNTYNLIMKLPDTDCLDLLPEDYTYGPLTLLRTILPLAFKQISVTKPAIALLWQDVDGYGSWECHDAWYQIFAGPAQKSVTSIPFGKLMHIQKENLSIDLSIN